jgi:beta-lactamase superfamily II metal-dependent hydrolase
MILDIFRAGSGDCILITSSNGKTRILADAGQPSPYKKYIAPSLADVNIDVLYVSHIDEDHIGGVVALLDNAVAWRVFDHMKKAGRPWKQPATPKPPKIGRIWHNAFLETIEASNAVKIDPTSLTSSLASDANRLAALHAASGDPAALEAAEEFRMLALSVKQAIEVSWRIQKDQLDIPLNPEFGGNLMIWRKKNKPIEVGKFKITVLGPTAEQLDLLRREDWTDYLSDKKKKASVEKAKKEHLEDINDLASSTGIAFGGSQTVTPPNVASLVLLLEEGGKRILLTGDADDADMLTQFEKSGLAAEGEPLEVDVLKVPHHGADNSYSDEFAEKIRARHYVFCGDVGKHGNPELEVVKGYIKARKKAPPPDGEEVRFWFNCSSQAEPAYEKEWKRIEALFRLSSTPAWLKAEFLTKGESIRLEL